MRIVKAVFKWALTVSLALAGCFFALRYSPLRAIEMPEGLRIVLDVCLVGLAIVSTLELLISRREAAPSEEGNIELRPGGLPI